ncbi:uncharacterized protein BCR38DRAFT_343816 [Pseudomassariella vexata]|uniref:Cupredoxin n=1 Tax=Pseudomassariella vexata TaxID=1141098 RepID=A0A1Y2DXQ9_9PEZI|nr:uncharacterized protein BCR38DRAFT_343816 [Pseudomassariella vexata]ORY64088.1 hypothetical protein BCR38DRAFT_343816 [Pseudomassariella vexata]
MRFAAALALAIAPVALAKAVHNVYPVRRDGHKDKGDDDDNKKNKDDGKNVGNQINIIDASVTTQIILIWNNPGGGAPTTTLNDQVTVTQTVTAKPDATEVAEAPAAAATHNVIVGGAGGLVYTPAELKAAVGDMVIFEFQSTNHTATQSAFATPCDPLEGGMDTGFQPNPDNSIVPAPQVAMQVMTTSPVWFYCKQMGHCGKGMVFSINPTADKTQAMFQSMAIAQKGTGAGSAITGNATEAAPPAEAPPAEAAPASSAPPAEATAPAEAAPPAEAGAITSGTGTTLTGETCICAVACGAGAFPAIQAQGLGAFGGIPGGLPASMVEA